MRQQASRRSAGSREQAGLGQGERRPQGMLLGGRRWAAPCVLSATQPGWAWGPAASVLCPKWPSLKTPQHWRRWTPALRTPLLSVGVLSSSSVLEGDRAAHSSLRNWCREELTLLKLSSAAPSVSAAVCGTHSSTEPFTAGECTAEGGRCCLHTAHHHWRVPQGSHWW